MQQTRPCRVLRCNVKWHVYVALGISFLGVTRRLAMFGYMGTWSSVDCLWQSFLLHLLHLLFLSFLSAQPSDWSIVRWTAHITEAVLGPPSNWISSILRRPKANCRILDWAVLVDVLSTKFNGFFLAEIFGFKLRLDCFGLLNQSWFHAYLTAFHKDRTTALGCYKWLVSWSIASSSSLLWNSFDDRLRHWHLDCAILI